MITGHEWLARNSVRAYPLDDNATGQDDSGQEWPDDLIVDLRLGFPPELGQCAYVASFVATEAVVSVLIGLADGNPYGDGLTEQPAQQQLRLAAAATVLQPVKEFQRVALRPLLDGVSGWLVLGRGVRRKAEYRFSDPAQSLLMPRLACPYLTGRYRGLRVEGQDRWMRGLIHIVAAGRAQGQKEARQWGYLRGLADPQWGDSDVYVLSLKESATGTRSVLADFLGYCDKRPESYTCLHEPIETINGVGPDEDGNIRLEFTGAARAVPLAPGPQGIGVQYTAAATGPICPDRYALLPGPQGELSYEQLLWRRKD